MQRWGERCLSDRHDGTGQLRRVEAKSRCPCWSPSSVRFVANRGGLSRPFQQVVARRVRSEASQRASSSFSRAPSAAPCRAGIRSAAVTGKRAAAPRATVGLPAGGQRAFQARRRGPAWHRWPASAPSRQPSAAGAVERADGVAQGGKVARLGPGEAQGGRRHPRRQARQGGAASGAAAGFQMDQRRQARAGRPRAGRGAGRRTAPWRRRRGRGRGRPEACASRRRCVRATSSLARRQGAAQAARPSGSSPASGSP